MNKELKYTSEVYLYYSGYRDTGIMTILMPINPMRRLMRNQYFAIQLITTNA
jgi:hypothetical protein